MTYMRKKTITVYVAAAFALAWAAWIGTAMIFGADSMQYTLALSLGMLAPLLAAIIASGGISPARSGILWRPAIKGNVKWYIAALVLPTALTLLGAVIYYAVFPERFDTEYTMLVPLLEGSGISPRQYLLLMLLQCMTLAPFINAVFAVGEEAGWRGFMYPRLQKRFGYRRGMVIGGIIWGLWHLPATVMGHNFGFGYWGYPITGILTMCLFCVGLGILLGFLYEKSGSVWPCALAHGAINAVGSLPGYVMLPEADFCSLVGPSPVGFLSGLPIFIIAAVLLFAGRSAFGGGKSDL